MPSLRWVPASNSDQILLSASICSTHNHKQDHPRSLQKMPTNSGGSYWSRSLKTTAITPLMQHIPSTLKLKLIYLPLIPRPLSRLRVHPIGCPNFSVSFHHYYPHSILETVDQWPSNFTEHTTTHKLFKRRLSNKVKAAPQTLCCQAAPKWCLFGSTFLI